MLTLLSVAEIENNTKEIVADLGTNALLNSQSSSHPIPDCTAVHI